MECRGLLEMPQCFDLPLRIVLRSLREGEAQLLGELRPARLVTQHTLVDQLIEQQRIGGNLTGEKIAVRGELDQALARLAALVEQREIRRAWTDRLDHAQHA